MVIALSITCTAVVTPIAPLPIVSPSVILTGPLSCCQHPSSESEAASGIPAGGGWQTPGNFRMQTCDVCAGMDSPVQEHRRPQTLLRRPAALDTAIAAHLSDHRQRAKALMLSLSGAAGTAATACSATRTGAGLGAGSDASSDTVAADTIGHCGLDAAADRISGFLDAIADSTDEEQECSSPAVHRHTGAAVAERLVTTFKEATGDWPQVLDIGCGDGALLSFMHESIGVPWSCLAGLTVDPPVGWDLRTSSNRRSTTVFVEDFESSVAPGSFIDGETCNFDWSQSFDLIFSFNTFHHFVDPLGGVSTAFSLLKPCGVMYVAGVPIDSLVRADTAAKSFSSHDDMTCVRILLEQMRRQGEHVELLLDDASVSVEWIRRGRVLWLQQKLPHRSVKEPREDEPFRFIRYDPTEPVVLRYGCLRANYILCEQEQPQLQDADEGGAQSATEDQTESEGLDRFLSGVVELWRFERAPS
eukprot:COSAG05_NODE_1346_length_5126_cov_12.771434_4_plen_473_part_00